MVKIVRASISDIPLIHNLAHVIWPHTYSALMSNGQLKYMLATLYSAEALEKIISTGEQTFLLLHSEHTAQGFASYGLRTEDQSVAKLHKLYILPECQGLGYGKMLIEEVKTNVKKLHVNMLDVNVKKDNPAKHFYEKLGFTRLREEQIPFGPYTLEDYVMRLDLTREP